MNGAAQTQQGGTSLAPAPEPSGAMVEVASSRVSQEVQAMVIVAKKFPRNEAECMMKLINSCRNERLAAEAMYTYPRGGQKVEGPSIRLAEAMARAWGNMDFGIIEVEQRDGESVMMAYAWDLENNLRETKIFNVPHLRYTRKGTTTLTDPRDIYEMTANQGARRMRACILGVIPKDVQDEACEACAKTLAGGHDEDLQTRLNKLVVQLGQKGVTRVQIEERYGHSLESLSEQEYVNLQGVLQAINDNYAVPEQYFKPANLPNTNGGKTGFGFNGSGNPQEGGA